jgi:hypothetical protein
MQKNNAANDEAQHLLRKMLLYGGTEVAGSHQWLSEFDRWKELVLALLTRTTSLPQNTVRLVTEHLLHLDLLQVPVLAQLLKGKPLAPDLEHPNSRYFIQALQESGFSHDEAVKGLTVVCEAATALSANFSGKIQLYLRSYGEKMVEEAQTLFHFSQLDQEAVQYAFTLWLQNVLHMPLSLQDEIVESFSNANGLTSKQVFDAADELDINVALVDDLLHHFQPLSEEQQMKLADPEKPRRKNKRERRNKMP